MADVFVCPGIKEYIHGSRLAIELTMIWRTSCGSDRALVSGTLEAGAVKVSFMMDIPSAGIVKSVQQCTNISDVCARARICMMV